MAVAIAITLMLLAVGTTAAQPHGLDSEAIERAQTIQVSSFDPALPNLTLQSFPEYETDHAQIDWTAIDYPGRENAICVRAETGVNDQIRVFITIQVSSSLNVLPKLVSVEVTEHGLVHSIHLSELPVVLHGRRFPPREIRDIPRVLSTVG